MIWRRTLADDERSMAGLHGGGGNYGTTVVMVANLTVGTTQVGVAGLCRPDKVCTRQGETWWNVVAAGHGVGNVRNIRQRVVRFGLRASG
ncbi:hypothetical protein L1987_15265 [Smallanthus sonchifolius]|uniref:Uncharacterized protein n=1 Tax=Smallanthus sonchifolius TaxID=185202 RepID=A0ACB9J794_9ASTR|nr:hypothetical protein L1987_15265 [Smallanthus sonchifolius]